MMSVAFLRLLSKACFFGGFVSILAAIVVWFLSKEPDAAHGERFGIFVGLWAPTFFTLSVCFDRQAASKSSKA